MAKQSSRGLFLAVVLSLLLLVVLPLAALNGLLGFVSEGRYGIIDLVVDAWEGATGWMW